MPMRKKLVQVGGSRAVIIPNSYLNYWCLKGKIIHEFGIEINKKIILKPIFKDIKSEIKEKNISEIETKINSLLKGGNKA